MNQSVCSILQFSLQPFVEDIFTDSKGIAITAIVFLAVTLFTLLANLMFIITMLWTNRTRNYRRNRPNDNNISMMLMISMALSDLANSVSVMPLSIVEVIDNGKWNLGAVCCQARLAMNDFFCSVSILHVNCMALDRYMAVCKPLFYRTLTSQTGYVMVVVSWLAPTLLVALPRVIGWDTLCATENTYMNCPYADIVNGVLYLSLFISYVLYCVILREVSKFHKRTPKYSNKPRSAGQISEELNASKRQAAVSIILANDTLFVDSFQAVAVDVMASKYEVSPVKNCLSDFKISPNSQSNIAMISDSCSAFGIKEDIKETCLSETSYHKNVDGFSQFDASEATNTTQSSQYSAMTVSPKDELTNLGIMQKIKTSPTTEMTCGQKVTAMDENQTALPESRVTVNPVATSRSIMATKAYGTVGCLVLCFTACWVPSWIFLPAYAQVVGSIRPWVVMVITWLAYLHGAINPVLYLSNRSVRNGVKAFCWKHQQKDTRVMTPVM